MENIKFEKALEKLERIVAELEDGDLPLEEALQKYEEGIKLSKVCGKKLSEVEKKVELLMKKGDGHFETEPFLEEEQGTKKVKTKKSKKKGSVDKKLTDEDLFLS